MVTTPQSKADFDKLSDEEFLKLSEEDYVGNVPAGQATFSTSEDPNASTQTPESNDGSEPPADDDQSDESNTDPNSSTPPEEGEEAGSKDPLQGEGKPVTGEETPEGDKQPDANAGEEGKTPVQTPDVKQGKNDTPAKAGYYKLPDGMDTAQVDNAIGFFKAVTTPFKADGKDFSVRSPEDAIRLMQQGVNYSRRMQELKPMKALNRMLQDQNLNDPEKLNFLIDVSKGDKAAITKLLKDHKIDPMDLDLEKETGYQARDYRGNPQDNEFRDALDNALTTPEGQALVSHIHKDWDSKSKARLREDPSILGTLQEFKASGVYDMVVNELAYQRSLGYLVGVPFLQAFDQVGEAMKNAGVFSSQTKPTPSANPMAPLNSGQPQGQQPVASGARKLPGQKKPEANPHLSSTPPSKQVSRPTSTTPDFDKLSDEEFLKMAPPS